MSANFGKCSHPIFLCIIGYNNISCHGDPMTPATPRSGVSWHPNPQDWRPWQKLDKIIVWPKNHSRIKSKEMGQGPQGWTRPFGLDPAEGLDVIKYKPNRKLYFFYTMIVDSYHYCIVFIHFYSASHSTSLSEALPNTATDTVLEFTRRSATEYRQLWVKDLPKVPTWRLERDSNKRLEGHTCRS